MSDMNKKPKNLHENHRERLRETFRKSGYSGLPDHNLLEFLLFYSIPRKDTNELAHRLIDALGSLDKVLCASREQLLEIEGIGESSAMLISLFPELFRRFNESALGKKINLSEPSDAMDYLVKKYTFDNKSEIFYMLCLDGVGNLINCCRIGEGSSHDVVINKRSILEAAFRNNADRVIFAHNHPNGILAPSKNDLYFTSEIGALLNGVGIRVADHIIVSGGEAFSLASTKKFKSLFV